jgi:hypothetical protein
LILHIERREGRRFVSELLRVHRYDPTEDRYEFESIYRRE